MTATNAWIDRFDCAITDAELNARTRRAAIPILDLQRLTPDVAVYNLRDGLNKIFVPTAQVRHVLRALVGAASVHSRKRYASPLEFIRNLHQETVAGTTSAPICMTGLSGVGKSELLAALIRLIPGPSKIDVPNHGSFPLVPGWHIVVRANASTTTLLRPYLDGTTGRFSDAPMRRALRDGVCWIGLDELQFQSQSAANAAVARLLMQMSSIGPPLVYVANFSLMHRLCRRPQEEHQRLFSDVHVINPDAASSEDWKETLRERFLIAPEFSDLSVYSHGDLIHNYTFGINRLVTELLCISYRLARAESAKAVSTHHIEQAYVSRQYSAQRDDIERLISIESGSLSAKEMKNHTDLWCPLKAVAKRFVSQHPGIADYDRRVAEAHLESGLTPEAKAIYQKARQKSHAPVNGTSRVTHISPRPPRPDRDALLAGATRFKDKIDNGE